MTSSDTPQPGEDPGPVVEPPPGDAPKPVGDPTPSDPPAGDPAPNPPEPMPTGGDIEETEEQPS